MITARIVAVCRRLIVLALAGYEGRQRLVAFGGRRRPDRLFDMWEWDGDRWRQVHP